MMLMPNVRHIEGYPEVFPDAMTLTERTRNNAGYALVGYWIPPNVFEGRVPFFKLFGSNSGAGMAVDVRETVSEYNKRTKTQFIVNLIDVQKHHQPMLEEFKNMSLKHLEVVYGFHPDKDNVQMFLHGPLFGDATAGLHVHVRVNQRPAAGEADTNILSLDKLLSVLQDDAVPDSAIQDHLLGLSAKTKSGLFISFNSVSNKKQYEGIPVTYVPNPWKRP